MMERQSVIIKEIERIYTNFKKDPKDRKTPEYFQKKIETIDSLWDEFKQNDLTLQGSEDKSSDYFTKNIYQQTEHFYQSARAVMEAAFKELSRPSTPILRRGEGSTIRFEVPFINTTAASTDTVSELLSSQQANFRALERQIKRIDEQQIEEKWEIEDELKNLQHRWRIIDDLHLRIDSILKGRNTSYEDAFAEIEDKFTNIKRKLNRKLCSTAHLHQSVPQIEIPIFTGKYTLWPTFCDLYTEAIHNNKHLTSAQKMQHLKGRVKGEAERLIQHLHISAENYEAAWDILNHRYNNPQLLFTNQAEILLNQHNLSKQSSFELKKLYDTTTECIHAIHNLGVDTNTWDPLLVHILSKKLDSETYSDYKESRKEPRELPTLQEFMSFIEAKFTALEPIQRKEKDGRNHLVAEKPSYHNNNPTFISKSFTQKGYQNNPTRKAYYHQYQAAPVYTRKSCAVCRSNHDLFMCKTFLELPAKEKIEAITKNKICPNCLYKHYEKQCTSIRRCKECNENHNTLIHEAVTQSRGANNIINKCAFEPQPSTSSSTPAPIAKSPRQHHTNYVAADDEEILLTTISIKVKSADNNYITLRALLDQGSQISIISESAAQALGLQRQKYHASISGIGPSSKQSKGVVTLECQSIYEDYNFITQALVISRVINSLPNSSFKRKSWPHIQHIQLADPDFNVSKPIDLLLDASVYSDIIMEGLIRGPARAPIAQQTRLGWILSGNIKTFSCNVIINHVDELAKYWEIEDITETQELSPLSEQEQYCEDLYQKTTKRLDDGKYEVAIPMKPGFENDLGASKSIAISRFLQIERQFEKHQQLSDGYRKFMTEYQELGHMRKADTGVNETTCYLPHHGVLKLDSSTTSLRVVFNASSKTSSGRSLNDLMESGPNLQQDLQSLILKWRAHKYVLTADIEKMFRQIYVRTADQCLQTIIWRNSPRDRLQEYHLTTVTYGNKSSPFLAMRTLRQIAKDNEQLKHAAYALNHCFYMDDLLCSVPSLEEARKLQQELIEVLKKSGMNLRKWASNEQQLIQHLPLEQQSSMYEFKDSETRKTLGLMWNPASDSFSYQYKGTNDNNHLVTKRQLLSEISKVYDPLGWLSPLTVRGKLLFQQTWLSELSWDDTLPLSIEKEWCSLKQDISTINMIHIPRYLGHDDGAGQSLQLHGFCDASEKAYACCVYLVTVNDKGERTSKLVTAKTKVAPTKKQISLPRLELLGSVLLSKLMKKVLETLSSADITITKIYAWTDSMIVLGWIHGELSKWKLFVANRVREIIDVLPASCWHHIRSEENAADCATRGLSTKSLSEHSLWWEGPRCILDYQDTNNSKYEEPTVEVKKKHNVHTALHATECIINLLLHKMSSITSIAKTIAYVLRFIARLRKQDNLNENNKLSSSELKNAYEFIIRKVQSTELAEDLSHLKNKGHVKASSRLASLNPYVDDNGILRVGGRLEHSHLRYSAKHPIILPSSSRLTQLIINQAHVTTLHGGPKLTLSYIRETYWIVSGIRTVKKQLRDCVICKRFKQTTGHQIMADLPQPRVTPSRPFTKTGLDFTGYLELKLNKGRGVRTTKGYVAVFVCLVTKAVHLEVVSNLSTEAFLAAFRRLCSRRGTPKHVFSDNGTNFVGASRILKKEHKDIIKSINPEIMNNNDIGVTWHFNAPAWPSAGGLWESAVKSVKYHLKRVVGEQKLTYEELTTLLQQIEACMNSRPLCSLTEDPEDLCLTPGHFLVGGPIISRPQTDPDITHLSTRWQLVQNMNKQIWKKWSSEYLQQMQSRSKWRKVTENIKIDDVVIIKEENMPPGKWALARVCELHPGKDGHVRVVTLKTQNNIIKRPINKLIILPTQEKQSENNEISSGTNQKRTINQSRPRKAFQNNFIIMSLLFLLSIIPASLQQSLNIAQINNTNSLYFDKTADMQIIKDKWTTIVYYNMTNYWQSIESLDAYINNLRSYCDETDEKDICSTLITQYDHDLNEIKHYNDILIFSHYHRTKRALLNAVGNVANILFGVLDDKFAEKYQQDIEKITHNEAHLLQLLKNQTSVVEAQNNILHRHAQHMDQQFGNINKQLYNISQDTNIIRRSLHILSNGLSLNILISNIRRIQESLISTVTDIYQGRIDIHILSPDQLKEQLNIISGQLNRELTVPVKPENIKHLYEILQVKAKIKGNYLIMEIKIPLTTSENYEINHVISLPQVTDNKTIYAIPITEFIAFNMRKDTFIPMTQTDLLSCTKYHQDRYLCGLNAPIYELKVDQSICDIKIITNGSNQTFCKIKIIQCTDVWIKLHSSDAWLYSCCEECPVRVMCPASLTSRRLRGSGIITIGQDCAVKGDTFTLIGHHDYRNQLEVQSPTPKIEIPLTSGLNEFINTSIPIHLIEIDKEDEIKMKKQIQSLKEATIDDVSIHDKHHYVMIYTLLFISILLIICVVCLFIYFRRQGQSKDRVSVVPPPKPVRSYTAPPGDNTPSSNDFPLYAKPSCGSSCRTRDQTTTKTIEFEDIQFKE